MYTGYELTAGTVDKLLKIFPPKYPNVVCHHITYKFGTKKNEPLPPTPESVKVVGYIDSGDGVEGLLVSIDGDTNRQIGGKYHITLSLNNDRKPVETNKYVDSAVSVNPISIDVTPKNFYSIVQELNK